MNRSSAAATGRVGFRRELEQLAEGWTSWRPQWRLPGPFLVTGGVIQPGRHTGYVIRPDTGEVIRHGHGIGRGTREVVEPESGTGDIIRPIADTGDVIRHGGGSGVGKNAAWVERM